MAHIDYRNKDRAGKTDTSWLRVGADIGKLANTWAGRNDLVAYVGENAGEGLAPAMFKPQIAEIEICTEAAFGFKVSPEKIGDIQNRKVQLEYSRAAGAIFHEAMHARYSMWSLEKAFEELARDEFEALVLLEEGRIESLGVQHLPKNRVLLRSCAFDLVLGEITEEELESASIAPLVKLVALVQGRVIAKVFDSSDVSEITSLLEKRLGEKRYARLSEIMQEFQQHKNHYDISAMYPLAREWAAITKELQEENGETPNSSMSQMMKQMMREEIKSVMKKIMEKAREAAEQVEIANSDEILEQEMQERWNEQIEENKAGEREQKEALKAAEQVFKATTEAAGKTFSRLQEQRKPNDRERRAAVIISRMLEKAKYRDRDVTEVPSVAPAGRLRPKALVQNAAMKQRGLQGNQPAWRKKVRKHTDEPTLTVGVMVDISGSMRSAMQPMATTAWVMSEAVRRVQGKTAMVYYGRDVFATLKPGQKLDEVKVWSASDPTEKFDKAFRALDGSLNLLNGNGARMLVVVSDGEYTHEEAEATAKWLQRCKQEGVAVLWLTFSRRGARAENIVTAAAHGVVVSGEMSPEEVAEKIGASAAKALEAVAVKAA